MPKLEYIKKRRWWHFVLLTMLPTFAVSIYHHFDWPGAAVVDNWFYDQCMRVRGPYPPYDIATRLEFSRNIRLVETRHQIPRPLLAKLLKKLRYARAVAFDLMFIDPRDDLSTDELQRPEYQEDIRQNDIQTRELLKTVRQCGNVVISAWPEFTTDSRSEFTTNAAGTMQLDPDHLRNSERILDWQKPPDDLWKNARWRAEVRVDPDEHDTHIRAVKLIANIPEPTPCLALALACAVRGIDPSQLSVRNGLLQFGNTQIPVDSDGKMLINYLGPQESFQGIDNKYDYLSVLDFNDKDIQQFRDKVIIIGEVSQKAKEIKSTPFGNMPGMQIHAHILGTLLNPAGPPRPVTPLATLLFAWLCGILVAIPLLKRTLWASLGMGIVGALGVAIIGAILLSRHNLVLPGSVPLGTIVLTFNAMAVYAYVQDRKKLGLFVGNDILSRTLGVFTHLRLGGTEAEATAFFCDLRGYTNLSEILAQDAINRLLQEYNNTLVNIVQSWEGRPIDFQGDGVFVLFEQGRSGRDHALNATHAAFDVRDALTELIEKWHREGVPRLQFGIGIVTGTMTIGIVGGEKMMKMGAVGGAVNLAARIQGKSQECGYPILVTAETKERIQDVYHTVSCGHFELKGRTAPVEIFGVVAPLGVLDYNATHSAPAGVG